MKIWSLSPYAERRRSAVGSEVRVKFVSLLWKIPVIAVALIMGGIAACQVTWSGADIVLNGILMGVIERTITGIYFLVGSTVAAGTLWGVYHIAKPGLWVLVPVMAYSALVLGLWSGIVSDFDYSRGEAIRYHTGNSYVLSHMTPRGLYRSCHDDRIELTEDGKAYCASALKVGPGENIPGSEHMCIGLWEWIFGKPVCFYTSSSSNQ
jgi:hypothetical protein